VNTSDYRLAVVDVHTPDEIAPAIQRALCHGAPCFIELVTSGEKQLIPLVAEWQRMAKEAVKQS
jgi:thiamine pyrophosphate-dependent acetolactate synthase large subunit-like protein